MRQADRFWLGRGKQPGGRVKAILKREPAVVAREVFHQIGERGFGANGVDDRPGVPKSLGQFQVVAHLAHYKSFLGKFRLDAVEFEYEGRVQGELRNHFCGVSAFELLPHDIGIAKRKSRRDSLLHEIRGDLARGR